jgi:hypothetical protein
VRGDLCCIWSLVPLQPKSAKHRRRVDFRVTWVIGMAGIRVVRTLFGDESLGCIDQQPIPCVGLVGRRVEGIGLMLG